MADPFAASVDEDPAADFLAREQQELAGLEDDGFGGSVSDTSAAVESNQGNPADFGNGLDLFGDLVSSKSSAPEPFPDFSTETNDKNALPEIPIIAPTAENHGIALTDSSPLGSKEVSSFALIDDWLAEDSFNEPANNSSNAPTAADSVIPSPAFTDESLIGAPASPSPAPIFTDESIIGAPASLSPAPIFTDESIIGAPASPSPASPAPAFNSSTEESFTKPEGSFTVQADDLVASVKDSLAKAENSLALVDDLFALVEDSLTPAEDSLAPAECSLAPAEDSLAPAEDSLAPAEDLLAPAKDSLAPAEDSLAETNVVETSEDAVIVAPLESTEYLSSPDGGGFDKLLDPLAYPAPADVVQDDGFGIYTAVEKEVNGCDSPSESEVAPTQKTLLWREEQLKKIAEKDKNEEVKLEEWRNTAKRELEEWYARQAEQVEKHKKNNRVAEAEFVKERDETTPGNEWERISRLCDFNPKNNKNTKDVSKLRSLLLQLKQNPVARSSTTS